MRKRCDQCIFWTRSESNSSFGCCRFHAGRSLVRSASPIEFYKGFGCSHYIYNDPMDYGNLVYFCSETRDIN